MDTRFDMDWCEECNVRRGYVYIVHFKGYSMWLCWECEQEYKESEIDQAEYLMDNR